ncbi:MAG: hypothetical protein MI755_23050 [Sphingomonadales bacterium]|nr:hypothetical protein [Sphingomonadales bacterium]
MTSGKAINPARTKGKDAEIDDDLYLAERFCKERDEVLRGSERRPRRQQGQSSLPWLAVARSVV